MLRGSRSGSVPDSNRGNQSQQYSAYPQGQIPVVTSQAQHPQQQVRLRYLKKCDYSNACFYGGFGRFLDYSNI